MSEVHLEVMPLLVPYFGTSAPGHLRLTEAIEDGETIRDLLNQLVARHAALDGVLFDRQAQTLTEHVRLVLNERVVELAGGLDTVLADGDTVLVLAAFAGGALKDIETITSGRSEATRRRTPCQ